MKPRSRQAVDAILARFDGTSLAERAPAEQVRLALAIHFFEEGRMTLLSAARLAHETGPGLQRILADLEISSPGLVGRESAAGEPASGT